MEKEIKRVNPVTIEYTAKAYAHKAGDRDTVHKVLAETLVKKGVAKIVKKGE